ncbi:MAG TPA: hypothetical protein VK599_17265 [Streptosporangiaceae bacterium]|nr:hypothetical protein [Streptosporangiaceae bacterium]
MSTAGNTVRKIRVDRSWLWFVAWTLVGASWCLALLTVLTIGILVAPVALLLTVLLLTAVRRGSAVGLPGLLSGPSLLLFYVAYLNRGGPGSDGCTDHGNICTGSGTVSPSGTSTVSTSTQEWDPMPWLVAGSVLLVAGVVLFLLLRRQARQDHARRSPAGGPAGLRFTA